MRLELRDKPEEKREPVAKVWLEVCGGGDITLNYSVDGSTPTSMAYFNIDEQRFHVFNEDIRRIGYQFTSTYPSKEH